MKIEQISVFLENTSGRLADVAALLAKNDINIRAMALADTEDFGILRLIVNDPEKAAALLKSEKFTIGKNDVVAVVMPDQPGGLAKILAVLQQKNINVEYLYAFAQRVNNEAALVFRIEAIDAAVDAMREAGIRMLSNAEAQKM
jgi:hypothetical protein